MSVGFHFDMTRCTGCKACQVACKDKNRLEVGAIYRNAHSYSQGSFPEVTCFSYSASCNHCEDPMCLQSCPVGAIVKLEDGTVYIDGEACTGCEICISHCPYKVPTMLPSGKAGKCDGCYSIRQAGGVNACVAACPNRALDFGEMDYLKGEHGEGVNIISILPPPGTKPNLSINAKPGTESGKPTLIGW